MNDRTANLDLRPIIMRLVPRKWTADQALQAIALLQQVIAAIWLVHGEMLGRALLPSELPPADPIPPTPKAPPARRGG